MDTRTTYMGLELAHPIVASASPLSGSVEQIERMEEAGAAAVVMFSLFEEQIRSELEALDYFWSHGTESYSEALTYFPGVEVYDVGVDRYLEILRGAAERVDIPVLGSLNGITAEGWIDYATRMEEAGASGIELNIYYLPTESERSGAEVEQRYVDILTAVKEAVRIPVALKLNPYFSAMAHMAARLDEAGADALVLFNRFYQPDFDLESLEVVPSLVLSQPSEIRLPLLWIAVLYGRLRASLAASTGVHGGTEVVKYLLAGADVVMATSALLRHGVEHLATLRGELTEWMERREYESVSQLKGSMSQRSVADPTAFARANYIKVLEGFRSLP
ncbi:MAG: dihydroorotate dehydrogenase-like protein [Gemmatimonadota bacterium]